MKRFMNKNIKSDILYQLIIMLLAYCIAFSAFFYVGHGILNAYKSTEPVVKTGNEFMIKKGEAEYSFFLFNSDTKLLSSNSKDSNEKINAILSFAADLFDLYFPLIFIIIFFLFCLDLFTVLPDDLTLINRKVRLDD